MACLRCRRDGSRHRPRDGSLRVRSHPRKRKPPQGGRVRLVADLRQAAPRAAPQDDLRRRRRSDRGVRSSCRRARGVVRRRRRAHRALRRAGARRRARRGRLVRHRVLGVRAVAREAGRVRLRPRREGAGAANGRSDPRAEEGADSASRRRCSRRCDLPRDDARAAEGRRMISRLRGTAVARAGERIVLDVGGVGYALAVTPTAARLAERGGEVSLETYLHVREDALQLYGFGEPAERELFEHLLAVSGVGPKVALAIVSGSSPGDLRRAIALDDTARFEAIPGIGKKTAQRVVLELKEKLGSMDEPTPIAGKPHAVARDALIELGWSPTEAEEALAATDPDLSPEERVRQALRAA